jgi:hypothetical protein
MAPAKKQSGKGAPPVPAAKAVVAAPKKLTRKEKSALNKARCAEVQSAVQEDVRNLQRRAVAGLPRKTGDSRHKLPAHLGKIGLPSDKVPYTDELDAKLFQLLSTGVSLDTISQLEGMPQLYTLLGWMADEGHKLCATYTRARKLVIALYEDRAMSVALNPMRSETITTRSGSDAKGAFDSKEVREADNVERAKLALGAYQWALGWMVPKKHGRLADGKADGPNPQLEALFQSLKSGPAT